MRKRINIVTLPIFLLFSLFFIGCNKLGGIKGTVVNIRTRQPVSNAEVRAETSSSIESDQRYVVIDTKTATDGSFKIKGLRGKRYSISVQKGGYVGVGKAWAEIPEKSNYLLPEPIKLQPFPSEWLEISNLIIKDKKTGLIWCNTINAKSMEYNEAVESINQLNSNKYGGFSDWRFPTTDELLVLSRNTMVYMNSIGEEYNVFYNNSSNMLIRLGVNKNISGTKSFFSSKPRITVYFAACKLEDLWKESHLWAVCNGNQRNTIQ